MDKQDLIVISPFLSDNFFTKISKNQGTIAKIVSTKNGYGKLSKKIIKPFINEKKCRLLTSKNASELHAKIYCYGEKDGTYWIIGSSNATNNGCNILGESSNVEFNIGFKTSEEVYECFKNLLDGQYFSPFHHSDYEVYNKDSDGFDARDIYHNFIKNIKKIECLKTEASNKSYQCKITTGKEYEIKDRLVGDFWNIKDEGEYVEYIWESKVPMSSIRIRIVNENKKDEEQFREFGLSLYEYWSDDVKAELDAKCIVSYTDLLKHIQKQILAGKSRNRISLGQNKDNGSVDHKATNVNQGRNVNKIYSYESLLKLSQNKEKDDEFVDALAQVYELADQILKKDKGNIQQQNMKKLIDDLKKVEK